MYYNTLLTPHFLGAIIHSKGTLIIMEEFLLDKEIELNNIYDLFRTLDNAMNYCMENTEFPCHLPALSNYACEKFEKFVLEFQQIHYKYLEVKNRKI